ncbi:MAG: phospholipase [Bacteroidetes bacterium]|nr:phospholipase [Bacteroidota bacterium]
MSTTVVFVHGYSVTNMNTYGELPQRLQAEAQPNGLDIKVEEIFLSRYISFNDAVGLDDISRAFDTAVQQQLKDAGRFVCITHSTGGPVIRDWWNRFYKGSTPPLSHLIMLAPANFGSALARLGKSRLSRIKTWFEGVDPGQRVLDWLECGSSLAWELNSEWIRSDGSQIGPDGVFPFVITGQSIDRKLYDHLNSYTGELGSDGVVRTASTNLNATYIKLVQKKTIDFGQISISDTLEETEYQESPVIPLRIIKGKSHSGDTMGIMKSVKKETTDANSSDTVKAIYECIKVSDLLQYRSVIDQFKAKTAAVQADELIETDTELFFVNRKFYHDKFSQVIFRVKDSQGYSVTDYDLIFTAGPDDDANHLPPGFAVDRQQNKLNPETITYFFNYDVMDGTSPTLDPDMKVEASLGLKVIPRPDKGFVRYAACGIKASDDFFDKILKPNSTTLIDIELQRMVSTEVFRLEKIDDYSPHIVDGYFDKVTEGSEIIE